MMAQLRGTNWHVKSEQMNSVIKALQPHIGQLFVTNWKLYLYDKRQYIDAHAVVLLLDISSIDKFYRAADGAGPEVAAPQATTAEAATATTGTRAEAAAFLLFPDGIKRWTYAWQGVVGFEDCLKIVDESV